MTEFLTEFLTENNFNSEGLKFAYYIPNFNHRGWGCVYARFYVGDTLIRISTKAKIKKSFWNDGIIIYPANAMMSDKILMRKVDAYLIDLMNRVDKVYCDYLCNENEIDSLTLINNIKDVISPMSRKSKQPKSLLSMLSQTIEDLPNEKTKKTQRTFIAKYAEFLKVRNLDDDVESLNQKNIIAFRDWLVTRLSTSTAKTTLTNFITIAHKCERKFDVNFRIDRNRIQKVTDSRTTDEKRENVFALTHEDLNKLIDVQLTKTKSIIRDLFLIQCFTSVRIEDLPELLNPNNRKEINGVVYAIFNSEKTKTKYIIPLNDNRLYPHTLELVNRYANLEKIPTSFNTHLKEIARIANLDTIFTHTSEINGKKNYTQMRVYEKISSHWGRHTFITNAVRYFGLSPKEIKHISSHSDERMIETTYTNTTTEDNINILSKALQKGSVKSVVSNSNYDINGIDEAKSVMRYLQIDFENDVTFDEAISKIAMKQIQLIEDYGINIDILKDLFNLSLPLRKRVEALHALLLSLK